MPYIIVSETDTYDNQGDYSSTEIWCSAHFIDVEIPLTMASDTLEFLEERGYIVVSQSAITYSGTLSSESLQFVRTTWTLRKVE